MNRRSTVAPTTISNGNSSPSHLKKMVTITCEFEWRKDLYGNHSPQQDLQLCSLNIFHL
jgi:hypothetical protein